MKVKVDFGLLLKHSRPKKKPFLLYIVALRRILDKILCSYNIFNLTNYETYYIFVYMAARFDPYRYFAYPQSPGQKQYEANAVFFRIGSLIHNLFRLLLSKNLALSWHRHLVQTIRWRLYQTAGKIVFHGGQVFVKVQRGLCQLLTDIRLSIWEFAPT